MIKIDWSLFLVSRVILGLWVLRRRLWTSDGIFKWKYSIVWHWKKADWHTMFPGRKIPWHRCWKWSIWPKTDYSSEKHD